jgi:predicted AAA+ superfamily ATPase
MPVTFPRLLRPPDRSFFLFGPRGVGKTFLLRSALPDAVVFDLLDTGLQIELARQPGTLEARVAALPPRAWVWIDEVQKVPAILDEVHRLMERHGWRFALSGSSARKLLRQGANLLAGRASTRFLEPLSFAELGDAFDLSRLLRWGALPMVVSEPAHARDILTSYVYTYVREEIKEEGLVRKAEPFLRFLEIAGALNGQVVNFENIGREAHVPRKSVVQYFSILEDTLVAHRLPPFQPQVKVREAAHPKYYWVDQGIARAAAGLAGEHVDADWLGRALETLVFHELRVYNHTAGHDHPIAYYRTRSGLEVDFVVQLERQTSSRRARIICIEVKSSRRWDRRWEAPMRDLSASAKVSVARMIGVYLGETRYRFDGVEVRPVADFLRELASGGIF